MNISVTINSTSCIKDFFIIHYEKLYPCILFEIFICFVKINLGLQNKSLVPLLHNFSNTWFFPFLCSFCLLFLHLFIHAKSNILTAHLSLLPYNLKQPIVFEPQINKLLLNTNLKEKVTRYYVSGCMVRSPKIFGIPGKKTRDSHDANSVVCEVKGSLYMAFLKIPGRILRQRLHVVSGNTSSIAWRLDDTLRPFSRHSSGRPNSRVAHTLGVQLNWVLHVLPTYASAGRKAKMFVPKT